MSGGVDSSVAAALLLQQGHDVVGATMKLWGGQSDQGCCSVSDVDDARRVASQIGIDHHVFGFGDEFNEHVIGPYVEAHALGRTPNPCIECNRHIKFDKLIRRARALGFDAVATGHHARVVVDRRGVHRVARGADRAKDQSYVLYMLDAAKLARTLLPLGTMTKSAVRAEAARLGLRTAAKPDSQDVCFITSSSGRSGFLAGRAPRTPGLVVDRSGKPLGSVPAVELVTIGQRHGLGLAGGGSARYAIGVDVAAGTVTVGGAEDLLVAELRLEKPVWSGDAPSGEVLAQCSAHGTPRAATFDPSRNLLEWDEPQRRVAPGQAVVLYDGDSVLGGGIACNPLR